MKQALFSAAVIDGGPPTAQFSPTLYIDRRSNEEDYV